MRLSGVSTNCAAIYFLLVLCAQHAGAGEENSRSIASNSAVRTWDESQSSGRRRIAVAEANRAYPEKAAKHRYTLS